MSADYPTDTIRDQPATLARMIDDGGHLDEAVLLAHVALALAVQGQQMRGLKDGLRDIRDVLGQAFPFEEGE